MNIIKYIMLLILWISMSLIGKIIAKKYSYRVEELEEMKNALNIFKNKIKFTYSPIGEIFEEISQNTSIKNIANIFTQAKNNMNNQTASEAWDKSLELTEEFLEIQIQEAIQERKKNEKLYQKLGTIGGLAIVIILF